MLYHLLYPLHTAISAFNIFRYITFRMIYASLTAFLICFFLGPWMIRKLRRLQIGQYVRDDGPQTHLKKAGTPTMGGLLIIIAVTSATLLWADLKNTFVWIALMVLIGFGAVGFIDDYMKVVKKQSKGLSAKAKMILLTVLGLLAAWLVVIHPGFDTQVTIPVFKKVTPNLGEVLYSLCRIGHRRRIQRRQPYRRAGRIGHRSDDHCRRHLYDLQLRGRSCQNFRISANQLCGRQR